MGGPGVSEEKRGKARAEGLGRDKRSAQEGVEERKWLVRAGLWAREKGRWPGRARGKGGPRERRPGRGGEEGNRPGWAGIWVCSFIFFPFLF
jgi:hypothetical protein